LEGVEERALRSGDAAEGRELDFGVVGLADSGL
jgi:hypothetical protein